MKKLFLTFAFAVVTIAASAQVYLGGEGGFWRNPNDNHTQFSLRPEIGYKLDSDWSLGMQVGYQYDYVSGTDVHTVNVAPYARYTFAKLGPVKFFADGGFAFFSSTADASGSHDPKYSTWQVGITPGLSVDLNKRISFITHFGFLGYRDSDYKNGGGSVFKDNVLGEDGFGFSLNANTLQFGFVYNF